MSPETRRPWFGGSRVRQGMALAAPTSPHATPPEEGAPRGPASGPERFWNARRVRVALLVSLAVSVVVHFLASPLSFLPGASIELRDTDGELTIPIELLEGPAEPPPPPPPPPPDPPPPAQTATAAEGPGHPTVDASAPKPRRDAGAPHDAGPDAEADGASPLRAALEGDAGAADARVAGGGSDDAGIADGLVAGPTLVEIRMNVAVIRGTPLGPRLAPLMLAIPQWNDFLGGTDVDPIKDLDWIWIFGPSLLHTDKDAALLKYNMSDARAAKNIALLSKREETGGAFDAGVPGVKAWRARADRAWRVFLLPRPHYAAMVPPDFAKVAARAFSRVEPRARLGPDEAVRVMVKNPSHPMPFLPTSLTEMRFWVVPRSDGGADAYVDLDAPDEDSARAAAKQVKQFLSQTNSIGVKIMTRGVLNDVEVTSDGSVVKVHDGANAEQLEALYELVAAFLGVNAVPAASGSAATPAPQPSVTAPHR